MPRSQSVIMIRKTQTMSSQSYDYYQYCHIIIYCIYLSLIHPDHLNLVQNSVQYLLHQHIIHLIYCYHEFLQSCSADWAFSAVGSFSDNRCISGKDSARVAYSEQYALSCDSSSNGCYGSNSMQNPQSFLKRTGVPTQKCVSYKSGLTGKVMKCPSGCDNGANMQLVKSVSFEDVCSGEESIMNALTQGTIQSQLDVYSDFMYYVDGIYKHVSGDVLGQLMVSIVGYGEENSTKFWVVRNAWGTAWGEQGYFRIVRGTNECQIERQCFLTVV
ncbi:Cathepsin_B [Hexamita inflata]|uniref:Cathepsin B n=1 Tax=Hexamita inflata TaxID=28002 RepID=A0AA86TZL7_9EUKA|nr:Cathepsin B [Hexamita inflata]